jgi:hypothetical protein
MDTFVFLLFAFVAVTSTAQAQQVFPACSINPIGYVVENVQCLDDRASCGNSQPVPYSKPTSSGAFFTVPKGQVVILKTKTDKHQFQVHCILQQDVFPWVTQQGTDKKLIAFDLRNGQEVYTKEGEPWEKSSFARLGLPFGITYNDTFK